MGRIVTAKYRVEVIANVGHITPFSWKGRASKERLDAWVAEYNRSFAPGGVNAHCAVGRSAGLRIVAATLIRQSDDRVVAKYFNPLGVRTC